MRKFTWLFALAVPVAFVACQKEAVSDVTNEGALVQGQVATGNGAPSGSHYTLNIIGVPKGKTAPMDGNNGSRIFVNAEGKTNIFLTEGDFGVLDANGTDQDGARFSLPAPDADLDGQTEYSVFARALGKPGGSAMVVNCAYYDDDNDPTTPTVKICETDMNEILQVERTTGRSRFENVTRELLYIYVDITNDGVTNPKLYPIFSPEMENYFWEYDNNGLKVLQLRFYPVSTSVPLTN
jgi:hypothetical protein